MFQASQLCRIIGIVCAATFLAGCAIIPAAGPNRQEINNAAVDSAAGKADVSDFLLVDVDDWVISVLSRYAPPTLRGQFGDRRPPPHYVIGVGDSVTVTVWEGAAGGLFSQPATDGIGTGSQSAVIPEQQVSQDGTIKVPFVGRIRVAGQTADSVEQQIQDKLTGKAIEPQALVVVTRSVNNSVTVIGEVNASNRIPLTPKGERILDVLALSGGNRAAVYETFVTLSRGGRNARALLQNIIADPGENIYLRPGDTLSLVKDPQTFTTFGATGQNALVPFGAATLSLEEAIAKSGGLIDSRADPHGVYLMRLEPLGLVRALDPGYNRASDRGLVRVIYQFNLRQAHAILLSRRFEMRNKDAIYIANAPISDLNKVLSIFSTVAQPVSQAASIANAF